MVVLHAVGQRPRGQRAGSTPASGAGSRPPARACSGSHSTSTARAGTWVTVMKPGTRLSATTWARGYSTA